MAENNNPGEKKLSVSSKTLTLKRSAETGVVRQSFSHGRTKSVVVEKVKRRVIGAAPEPKAEAPAAPAPEAKSAPRPARQGRRRAAACAFDQALVGVVLRTLSEEERSARANALTDFRVREAEERKQAEEDARRRASREGRRSFRAGSRRSAQARGGGPPPPRRRNQAQGRRGRQEAPRRRGRSQAPACPHAHARGGGGRRTAHRAARRRRCCASGRGAQARSRAVRRSSAAA